MTTRPDANSMSAGAYHTAKAGLKFLINTLRSETKQIRFVDFSLGRIKTKIRVNWGISLGFDEINYTGSHANVIEADEIAKQVDHIINNEHITEIYVKHIRR